MVASGSAKVIFICYPLLPLKLPLQPFKNVKGNKSNRGNAKNIEVHACARMCARVRMRAHMYIYICYLLIIIIKEG